MWFNKPKSYLGIDLGAGGVKLVELKKEKNRPVLFTYGFTSAPQDVHRLLTTREQTAEDLLQTKKDTSLATRETSTAPDLSADQQRIEKYADLIKSVCREARTVSKIAVVSLPVSVLFHAIVNLPTVRKEDFDRILKAEVKKLLPYSLEETSLDYQILPGSPEAKVQRILVNAVPRTLVMFYSKVFQRAGLKLESLEPESTALARCLIGRDTAVNMIIDIGAERTNFFIIDQAVAITHHSIELGGTRINKILQNILGVEENLVEQLKVDLFTHLLTRPPNSGMSREKFLGMLMPVVDPIAKEIEYSFDLFLRQSGNENKRPEKIILTGGGAIFPYLADYLADKFKLKCYVADPWGRVVYQEGLKPILNQIGPRLAVAIGLALKNVI